MPTTTTSTLPAPVQQSFNDMILSTPVPNYIHSIPAMRNHMPSNGGRIMRFRRYNPLAPAIVPLGNTGITPPSQLLTAIDIDAEVSFYGSFVQINEQVTLQAQDKPLTQAAIRLGDSLRKTEDILVRNMLAGSATIQNCVFGLNGDVPSNLTAADCDIATQTLMGNDAHMFTGTIEGELRFGTSPVRNSYIALCSTELVAQLNALNEFVPAAKYPDQNNVIDSEWGQINNIRFFVSSIGSVTPNASDLGFDVFNIFVCAKESYGIIEQDNYTAKFIYRPAIFSDPLAQNVTAGYKMAAAYRIYNDAWVLNLRATNQ